MKRTIIMGLVLFVAVVLTACVPAGYAVTPAIDCPGELEPHRASQRYHGYTFDTSPGCECDDSGLCLDMSDTVQAINHEYRQEEGGIHGAWCRANSKHSLSTADGYVMLWWDGNPTWVCVAYYEY